MQALILKLLNGPFYSAALQRIFRLWLVRNISLESGNGCPHRGTNYFIKAGQPISKMDEDEQEFLCSKARIKCPLHGEIYKNTTFPDVYIRIETILYPRLS